VEVPLISPKKGVLKKWPKDMQERLLSGAGEISRKTEAKQRYYLVKHPKKPQKK